MKKCMLTLAATILVLTAFSCGKDDVVPSKYQGLTGHGGSGSGSGNNSGNNSGSTDTGDTTPVIDYTKYSLGELAAQQGIKLGAAFTYWEYRNNPQVAEILTREFKEPRK